MNPTDRDSDKFPDGRDPFLDPGDPSIECPICALQFHPKRRFCPDCGEPRTVVKEQIAAKIRETGLSYDELLRRERESDKVSPQFLDVPPSMRPKQPMSRRDKFIVAVAAVIGGVLLIGLLAFDDDDTDASPGRSRNPATSGNVAVRYEVTHSQRTGGIGLTYENASGNTEQLETRVSGGEWTRTFTAPPGQFLYVSAQNQHDAGTVTCAIYVDGMRAESASSSGGYVIATCSTSVPR